MHRLILFLSRLALGLRRMSAEDRRTPLVILGQGDTARRYHERQS
jgi:hypothetical protein